MARGIKSLAKPELLAWARRTSGLSIEAAAAKLRIEPERLEAWEAGEKHPTIGKVRQAARIYKRPMAVFYLPKPPEEPPSIHDYRVLAGTEVKDSPALLLEVRKARYRRRVAIDLWRQLYGTIPVFEHKASLDDEPEVLAQTVRSLLDISIEEQLRWKPDGYEALRSWKNAVEHQGVLVFQTATQGGHGVTLEDMRGFSIVEQEFPIIVINSKDAVKGRIFTLLHELTHLLLHNGGVCGDVAGYISPATEGEAIEVFCNRVAGAVLVPEQEFLVQDIVADKRRAMMWDDHEISLLASRFSVSREVILRRLLILGKTTREFYSQKRKEYHAIYSGRAKDKSEGGPKYFRIVIRNNGMAYTRLVMEAYYQEAITLSNVAGYLGAKISHLDSIEQEVMGTAY